MNTFEEYLNNKKPEDLTKLLAESMDYTLTEGEEAQIDDAVAIFLAEGNTINEFEEEMTNEGMFGAFRRTYRSCIRKIFRSYGCKGIRSSKGNSLRFINIEISWSCIRCNYRKEILIS